MIITQPIWFLILIVCNTLAGLGYIIYGVLIKPLLAKDSISNSRTRYVIIGTVIVLCPIVGITFFILGFVFLKLFFHREIDISDVIFSKERVKSDARANQERDMNLAPMEEAIVISDTQSLRSYMINVIQGDIQKSLAAIALALNSSDSETSHYAASVLRDELNDFRTNTQKLYTQIKEDIDDEKICIEECNILITYMNSVLIQKVFGEVEQLALVHKMQEVCEILYDIDKENISGDIYEWISLRLLEVKEFSLCRQWCDRSMEQYPYELSSYTIQLKLYFTIQDRVKFFEVLESLKNSHIVIDSETLELIRTFS